MNGASRETLLRRVEYGGRKGRRAAKRLAALPLGGWEVVIGAAYALVFKENCKLLKATVSP
jgi:hypothetical protein